jgi:hypothetical protein
VISTVSPFGARAITSLAHAADGRKVAVITRTGGGEYVLRSRGALQALFRQRVALDAITPPLATGIDTRARRPRIAVLSDPARNGVRSSDGACRSW